MHLILLFWDESNQSTSIQYSLVENIIHQQNFQLQVYSNYYLLIKLHTKCCMYVEI